MKTNELLRQFEKVADAPNATARLRRFILDLAVRGKLVPQDAGDAPADALLNEIDAKRAEVTASSRASVDRSPLAMSEGPFELPRSWVWTRLGRVTSYIQRGKSPKYADSGGSPVVSQKCVQWSGLDLSAARLVTTESLADYDEVRFLRDGDLLWNSTGTGTIGRVIRLVQPPIRLVCDSHVTVVRCIGVVPEYVRIWLRSDHVYGSIEGRAAGSTNQVELTAQMATSQLVPLPPLAEQHRIVAKVDELMALCDQLEAAQAEREAARDRLTAASLARLTAPDTETFSGDAGFALDALPRFTSRSEQVQRLRQVILNLAVRGMLQAQDPADQPASQLLEQFAARKSLPESARDWTRGLPAPTSFQLPPGWAWTRIGDTCERVTVGFVGSMKEEYVESGIPFLRSQNVRANRFRETGLVFISREFHRTIIKSALQPGDVVVVRSGNVGTACAIPESIPEANCSDLVVVKQPECVLPTYLCFYMNSLAASHVEAGSVGVALTHLNTRSVATMPIPLPPIPEQRRIVAKVHELMGVCDQLEASLSACTSHRSRLLEALLRRALEPRGTELCAGAVEAHSS